MNDEQRVYSAKIYSTPDKIKKTYDEIRANYFKNYKGFFNPNRGEAMNKEPCEKCRDLFNKLDREFSKVIMIYTVMISIAVLVSFHLGRSL